jgi:hypothetical protein
VDTYRNAVTVDHSAVPEALRWKLERLAEYFAEAIASRTPDVEIDGRIMRPPRAKVVTFSLNPDSIIVAHYVHLGSDGSLMAARIEPAELTEAAKRLIDNLWPTYEQMGWDDLRRRLEAPARDTRKKTLISYRKTKPEYRRFAEAIAHRLGREGFVPWFDEWEVRAGDSLPREIGGAFKDVYGVIIVLTPDYPGGKWAREELETAITKRVEQGIKIIPLLYEQCELPELLRPLAYVDCTDHAEDQIEQQYRKIIDALNEVELNPYQ